MKGLIPGHSAQKTQVYVPQPTVFPLWLLVFADTQITKAAWHSALFWSLGLSCGPPVTTANGWSPLAMVSIKQPWLLLKLSPDTGTQSHDHWSTHLNSFPPLVPPLVFLEGME